VDLLGLKQEMATLLMSSDRVTHVVETERQKKKRKNHDLMTDCVMMGWIVAVTRQRESETRVLFPHSTTMMMFTCLAHG
jgi:hypothetical protein